MNNINKDKKTCINCNKELAENEVFEISSDIYCEDCRNELFITCESCSDYVWNEDSYCGSDEMLYCESCYDDKFLSCDSCSQVIENNDSIGVANGDSICNDCYSNYYSSCSYCDEVINQDDSHYCESCENDFCYDCFTSSEHDCQSEEVTNPVQFTKGKNTNEMPFSTFVGFELETFNNFAIERDWLSYTSDGSINPEHGKGIEYQVHPSNKSELVRRVKELTQELKNTGHGINKSCGLHIHMDSRELKKHPITLSHVLLTYYAFEDILYYMLPKSRLNNTYCKPLLEDYTNKDLIARKTDKIAEKWYKSPYWESITNEHYHSSRYHSFNVHSIFSRGTIEVRMHSATLESDKIINWIYILLAMREYAVKKYDKKAIRKAMRMKSNKDKLNYFLELFDFPQDKKEYIKERITKFNPKLLASNDPTYFDYYKQKARYNLMNRHLMNKLENMQDTLRQEIHKSLIEVEYAKDLPREYKKIYKDFVKKHNILIRETKEYKKYEDTLNRDRTQFLAINPNSFYIPSFENPNIFDSERSIISRYLENEIVDLQLKDNQDFKQLNKRIEKNRMNINKMDNLIGMELN